MPGIDVTHPAVAAQWHPTLNGDLKPANLTSGMGKKGWWICPNKCPEGCPHIWLAEIKSRCDGRGCPFCAKNGKAFCKHQTLAYNYPQILKIWHPKLNKGKTPDQIQIRSDIIIWLLCPNTCPEGCKHEWPAQVKSITRSFDNNKMGCPFCAINGKRFCCHMTIRYTHPKIASEFDESLNTNIDLSTLQPGSNIKAHWKCKKCYHIWLTRVQHRCKSNSGCPNCLNKTEEKLHTYLKILFPDIQSQYKTDWCKSPTSGRYLPFDFYIPSLKLLIELDGAQHFRQVANWTVCEETQKRDVYKMRRAFEQGISVIRLLQEEVLDETEEWLDIHLKPHLVASDETFYMFITSEKYAGIYNSHERLLESGEEFVFEDVESCEGSENDHFGNSLADFL